MLQYRLLGLHSIEKRTSSSIFLFSHQSYILHGYLWTYEGKIIVVNKTHPPPTKKRKQTKQKQKQNRKTKEKENTSPKKCPSLVH